MGTIRSKQWETIRAKLDATWDEFKTTENGDAVVEISKADGSTTRLTQSAGIWWPVESPEPSRGGA